MAYSADCISWRQWLRRYRHALLLLLCAAGADAQTKAPTIFFSPDYESPVRGDPGDLLLLAGADFSATDVVVYRQLNDTTQALAAPPAVPQASTADSGIALVASVAGIPSSLTVHLPVALSESQSYALWVRTAGGEWSNGIRLNDARPLWITPDRGYRSAPTAGLPRTLKVVGRNLEPAPGCKTQIRLIGPALYTIAALDHPPRVPSAQISRYMAEAQLPDRMQPGRYRVEISRDATSWVSVPSDDQGVAQYFTVSDDPPEAERYPVDDPKFGGCRADDGRDATACIVRAIAAARAHGGGSVVFGPGKWSMNDSSVPGVRPYDGILVPEKVDLIGAGPGLSILQRGTTWGSDPFGNPTQLAAFSLLGNNRIEGITFRDQRVYSSPRHYPYMAMLQIGTNTSPVSNVSITHNVFDRPYIAVYFSGSHCDHVIITNNEFGAFYTALFSGKSTIDDSIYRDNAFHPSSYLDIPSKQGVIATQLGGGSRNDFSRNTADGTSRRYLYDPQADAPGWRAAYFWSITNSVRGLLVSENVIRCSGDKDGDGEAIAYDNWNNVTGFEQPVPVLSATSSGSGSTITVSGHLALSQQNLPVGDDFYRGYWLQVIQGTGLAQTRRIASYQSGPDQTTFKVEPALDILPEADSRVSVAREFWQTFTLDNLVDESGPSCQRANRTRPQGGLISLYASATESVTAGNVQHGSSGILLAESYDQGKASTLQYYSEIRDNTIDGSYSDARGEPWSGIQQWLSASPKPNSSPLAPGPPTLGYGIVIAHNVVANAQGLRGGAVDLTPSWWVGPSQSAANYRADWTINDSTLIFGNSIDLSAARFPRVGISLLGEADHQSVAWRTVLYNNTCKGSLIRIADKAIGTVRYCPAAVMNPDSCECTGGQTQR